MVLLCSPRWSCYIAHAGPALRVPLPLFPSFWEVTDTMPDSLFLKNHSSFSPIIFIAVCKAPTGNSWRAHPHNPFSSTMLLVFTILCILVVEKKKQRYARLAQGIVFHFQIKETHSVKLCVVFFFFERV